MIPKEIAIVVILAAAIAVSTSAFGQDHSFDSDGVRIHFVDQGEGSPVLLVHGFTWNLDASWVDTGILPKLVASGFRVIALDLRGHGKSEWPLEASEYGREMVEDMRRLLDHLSIERAHIVGYSMGGTMTATFGSLYPNRTLSLMLGGTGLPARYQEAWTEEQAAKVFVEWNVPAELSPTAIAAMSATYNSLAPNLDELRGIQSPTQVIIGDADVVDRAMAMSEMISGSTLVVVPGDHDGATDTPEYYSAILSFLRANTALAN